MEAVPSASESVPVLLACFEMYADDGLVFRRTVMVGISAGALPTGHPGRVAFE